MRVLAAILVLALAATVSTASVAPPPAAAPPRALPCALPYSPPGEDALAASPAPAAALALRRFESTDGTASWAPPAASRAEHAHLSALAALAFDSWLASEGNATACGPATVPAVGITLTHACVRPVKVKGEGNESENPALSTTRSLFSLEFRARFTCGAALGRTDVAVTATLRSLISAATLAVANSDAPHAPPKVKGVWLSGGWEDSAALVAHTARRGLLPGASAPAPAAPADRVVFDGAAAAEQAEASAAEEAALSAAAAALSRALSESSSSTSFQGQDLGVHWATVQEQSGMWQQQAAPQEEGEADAAGAPASPSSSSPDAGPADAAFEAAASPPPHDFGSSPAADTAEAMATAFDAEQAAAAVEAEEQAAAQAAVDAAAAAAADAHAEAAAIVASGDTPAALAASDAVLDAAAAQALGGELSAADLTAVGVDPQNPNRFWATKIKEKTE